MPNFTMECVLDDQVVRVERLHNLGLSPPVLRLISKTHSLQLGELLCVHFRFYKSHR